MEPMDTFHLFHAFPAEIRLHIYIEALPNRILQMGYDFPFPFLRLHPLDPKDTAHLHPPTRCLSPVPGSLPALFHVCHESRQLCLSTYLPFAYTYAHPHKDILYISSSAASLLLHNMNSYRNCARPPLYPLAELDRVAVEFDWLDIPLQGRENGGWLMVGNRRFLNSSPIMGSYLAAFAEFGLPKELLLVGGMTEAVDQERSCQSRGWKTVELVGDPNIYKPDRSEGVLSYIHDNLYYRKKNNPWFCGELPDFRIVGVHREEEISREDQLDSALLCLGDCVARKWLRKEREVHGRDWDFDVDGSPYDREHMRKAIKKAKSEVNVT